MSNVLALTRVLIKNNVFAFSGKKKSGKKVSTKGSAFGFVIALIFSVSCLAIPMIYVLKETLSVYNISELLISYALPAGGITCMIFGVLSIINIFYFNKDSEQLLHMPIKSSELLMAKFFTSIISEYLLLAMFVFPIFIGVGVGTDADILYYVYTAIICLFMPIIPSVIISIFLMLTNKFFDFSRRKDLFMYVTTGLILIFSFAYSYGLQFLLESGNDLSTLVNGDNSSYIKISKYIFPFFNSAVYSLNNYREFIGVASIISFVGFNFLALVIMYYLGEKLYIKALTNTKGNQSKRYNIANDYKYSKNGVMAELIKKEWITIKRTPIFMLNIVVSNLIMPLFLGAALVTTVIQQGTGALDAITDTIDFNNGAILLVAGGALVFFACMNGASSSAISREGSNAKFMKQIPVSLKKQLDAKVYFSMIIDMVVILFIEGMLMFVVKAPLYFWGMLAVINALILLINNYVCLILDLRSPKLDWSEESEAVKQNLNVFWGMIVSLALSGAIIGSGLIILDSNVNILLIFAITSVILLSIYILINLVVKKYQLKLFNKVG